MVDIDLKAKLPIFLLVLCTLTFLQCADDLFGFILHIISDLGFMYGDNMKVVEMMKKYPPDFAGRSFRELPPIVFCVTGALLMLRLKRIGFFIYVIGAIIPVIFSVKSYLALSTMPNLPLQFGLSVHNIVIYYLIPFVFITLYAFNYKHLGKSIQNAESPDENKKGISSFRFLLVLCIITIATSIDKLFNIFTIPADFRDFGESVKFSELPVVSIVAQVLYIASAVLMLRLQKIGFYLYALVAVGFTTYFLTTREYNEGIMNFVMFYGWLGLSVAFLIMYACNYKHLK